MDSQGKTPIRPSLGCNIANQAGRTSFGIDMWSILEAEFTILSVAMTELE
jgi:hypothetical protein